MSSKEIVNYNYNCIEDSKYSDSNIKYSENNISIKEKVINDKDNDFVLIDKKDDKDSLINENKQEENKNYEIYINSFETNLNDEEILKAKDNGFVLMGKTGVGKTSLLNLYYMEVILEK
jgi:putative ribosome biogenesis GTPase RsgA